MSSHADQHDLDKLGRWHRDLTESSHSGFPVCAIFLVSADDRVAHDVFRKYRTSFEARNAGFENLVIFGQHGISVTAQRLLSAFGLSQEHLPTLALVAQAYPDTAYTLPLPSGSGTEGLDEEQPGDCWREALIAMESAADKGSGSPRLGELPGLAHHQLDDGSLPLLVSRLQRELS